MTENKKPVVLYVDDEDINLMLFSISFSKEYNIITAVSGSDAIEKLEKNINVDIVVSDMKMPEMTGIEFIKIAKAKYENISFFILTGYSKNKEISDAINSGLIIKYFSKPFDIKEIGESMQEALENIDN